MAARKAAKGAAAAADAVDSQLARYRSMRDFKVTAEPAGGGRPKAAAGLPFVIQKHAASHLHYDFRLGWNGVLKSWACAKGPSYVVGDKRLAVEVEDHPMEYGGFEGIIPAGQYGGGTVMVWDQGTWEPQAGHEDVEAGLRDGQLKFAMHGTKMDGKWALIRMHERPGGKYGKSSKPNWLLIKEHDEFERAADAPAVTEAEPKSAVTGRTLEEIAKNEDHVWNSKETAKGPQAWFRQDKDAAGKKAAAPQKAAARVKKAASNLKAADLDIAGLPEELQPSFLKPQLAESIEAPPSAAGWLHELKLDGYRMQARKQGAKVQMLTRSGLDWTERVKTVAAEVAKLPYEALTLDGEVVVLAENGTTNFADLQAAFQEGARNPLTYFVFDLLHVEGHSPRELPLVARKALLERIVAGADGEALQYSEHLVADGEEMFHKACALHAEGIISKKAQGRYAGSRNGDWVKSKCLHEQEFVVVGYTLPQKSRTGGPGLGSLLLGYYDATGKTLVYAGRTGTGFNQRFAAQLRKQLEAMEQAVSALKKVTAEARKDAIWVRPEMVAQVRFATWTADDQLRQAAFLGIREDKPAKEVRRETSAPTPKSDAHKTSKMLKPGKPVAMERAPVRLTHPEKVLDPASKLTKQQLADFYWAVAPRMLPHIAGRALSLVRLPNGIGGGEFLPEERDVNAAGGV